METIKLSGVDLGPWTVSRGTFYRPPVSVNLTVAELPGRHGAIVPGLPTFGMPQVTVRLSPGGHGRTVTQLESHNDMLMATLARPGVVVHRVVGGVERTAEARLVSASWEDDVVFGSHSVCLATFALPDVFFRDTSFQTLDVPAGSSTHAVLAGSAPITDAVVRWEWAAAPQPKSLVDVTTGTGISVSPQITGGTFLFADVGNMAAIRTAGSGNWAFFPGLTASREDHNVDYPGPGPLQLWPVVRESGGDLVREVTVQASHPCTIRYRRAWL